MTYLPLALYLGLFAVAAFAPLRWSVIGFLLLSTIDLGSESASIGALNTAKSMVLPVFLLWRFRAYAGHVRLTAAPVAWILLIVYVAVASTWSLFPAYAIKLIGHLLGSLLICMMLLRASKGGFLNMKTVVPVAVGTFAIATAHWFLLHDWGGEPDRFSTFAGAQSFAAFLTALYCAVVASRALAWPLRLSISAALLFSLLINGSRMWLIGFLASTLLAIFVSEVKTWLKVVSFAATVITASLLILEFYPVMDWIAAQSGSNRIARAVTDMYGGNYRSRGLGTLNLRKQLFRRTIAGIEQSSITEIVFGHGTCNGALIAATISKYPDPNRALHDEWLRAFYEWGIIGLILWLIFIASLVLYAARGVHSIHGDYAKPLLIYLPAFTVGLSGENIIAGAGNAVSVGLLMLIALAGVAHRFVRHSPAIGAAAGWTSDPSSSRAFKAAYPKAL
jgi:hypothetical protein